MLELWALLDLRPERIYNVDDTDITTVPKKDQNAYDCMKKTAKTTDMPVYVTVVPDEENKMYPSSRIPSPLPQNQASDKGAARHNAKNNSNVSKTHIPHNIFTSVSCNEFYENMNLCSSDTFTNQITPDQIVPLPRAERKSSAENKIRGKATVLISTPYKEEVEILRSLN